MEDCCLCAPSPLEQFDELIGWLASLLPACLLAAGVDMDRDEPLPLVEDVGEELGESAMVEENFEEQLIEGGLGYEGPVAEFLAALFSMFILINVLGLTPGVGTSTAQIQYVLPLAILCFLLVIMMGVYYRGLAYFGMLFPPGVPPLLAPLLVPIELISYFARPFSLGIRMFANMMAGHALMVILLAFAFLAVALYGGFGLFVIIVPGFIILAVCCLELAVAFLQSYVFTILACIYFREIADGH